MTKKIFEIQENKFSDDRLNGRYSRAWIEESFNFEKKAGKQKLASQTKNFLGTSINPKKNLILAIIVIAGFILLFGKIFYLQIIKGEYYKLLAEGNRIRLQPIISERGIIYDKNHKELVQNVPNFSLAIIPQDLPRQAKERNQIIDQVVSISGVPREQIQDLLKKYGSYSYASLVIKENLDYETALKLYIRSSKLPGIRIEKGSKRRYLINNDVATSSSTLSMSHIFGYLGKIDDKEMLSFKDKGYLLFDNIGKTGLEKTYESYLRGKYGLKKVEVDALGHEQNVLAEDPPMPGQNLILSIDFEAQQELENLIRKKLEKTGKSKAAAIVMDPNTGSILAMVSWPSFDDNEFSGGISQENYNKYISNKDNPLFNRAIGGTYPSGSTVKMVVAAAALQEKIITPNTTVLSVGGLKVGNWFFKDWAAGGHGTTNVKKAIAWSVNTFFYYIGGGYGDFTGLGVDRLTSYMRSFNISKKTGIDIPGEAAGFLPSKDWKLQAKGEKWYVGDTYNLSIGQGDLLVTPLQVALWTAAVANGGDIVQPHLVDRIENPLDHTETTLSYEKSKTPITPQNIEVVQQGMKDCVIYGSCQLLQTLPFSSAGKTGTAQWSGNKENHAWFTSFAPFEHPRVVVTILVEEGKEGSSVSEPIGRDFLAWWGKKYLK